MGIVALTPTTTPAHLIDLTGCTAIYTPGEGSLAFQSRDFGPMKTRHNSPIDNTCKKSRGTNKVM